MTGIGRLHPRLLVDDVEHLVDRAAERFLLRPARQPLGDRVDAGDASMLVGGEDGVTDAVERCGEALFAPPERLLGAPVLRDVSEDQHRAARRPAGVADGRTAVGDGPLRAVTRDQRGVIGEPDDDALGQHPGDGILRLGARLLVDDVEDLLERASDRLLLRPTGQPFGDRVDAGDAPCCVGGEHGVADAVEGRREALFAAGGASPPPPSRAVRSRVTLPNPRSVPPRREAR